MAGVWKVWDGENVSEVAGRSYAQGSVGSGVMGLCGSGDGFDVPLRVYICMWSVGVGRCFDAGAARVCFGKVCSM